MIQISETANAACLRCAEEIVRIIENRIETTGNAFIALSGGSTPKLLFEIIVDSFAGAVNWSRVHFFWVDERCVPPDHPESNYGMTREFLLNSLPVNEAFIHRIHAEDDPHYEIIRYGKEIVELLPEANNFPVFDIVLLGIGDDGHTASIFPNSIELITAQGITAVSTHPVSGQTRITLTGGVINNAIYVIFLVTGIGKSEVVAKILRKKEEAKAFPASLINPFYNKPLWYLDNDAAHKFIGGDE